MDQKKYENIIIDVKYKIEDNIVKNPKIPNYEKNKSIEKNNQSENLSDLVEKLNQKIIFLKEDNNRLGIEFKFLQDSYIKLLGEYISLENKLKKIKTRYK
jgi:stage III sporulation protein SpoIIIAA